MTSLTTSLQQTISNLLSIRWSRKQFGKALLIIAPLILLWVLREEISHLFAIISERDSLVAYLRPYGTLGIFLLYILLFYTTILLDQILHLYDMGLLI